jgi:hypothetical protein
MHLETFILPRGCPAFYRGESDEPELAANPRIEERKLEAGRSRTPLTSTSGRGHGHPLRRPRAPSPAFQ